MVVAVVTRGLKYMLKRNYEAVRITKLALLGWNPGSIGLKQPYSQPVARAPSKGLKKHHTRPLSELGRLPDGGP